jgi:hypothetical protein
LKAGGFKTGRGPYLYSTVNITEFPNYRIPNARYWSMTSQNEGTDVSDDITPTNNTKERMKIIMEIIDKALAEADAKAKKEEEDAKVAEEQKRQKNSTRTPL